MAMIRCPECSARLSDRADGCPRCGCPRDAFPPAAVRDGAHCVIEEHRFDKDEFFSLQYAALRKEIDESRSRLFALTVGTALLIPAAKTLIEATSTADRLQHLNLILPLVVIVAVLLFLSENNGVMRAGSYILHFVEARVFDYTKDPPPDVGWERFLQGGRRWNPRRVDTYLTLAFFTMAFSYYVITVFIAEEWARARWPEWSAGEIVVAVYAAVFVAVGVIMAKNLQWDTWPNLGDLTQGPEHAHPIGMALRPTTVVRSAGMMSASDEKDEVHQPGVAGT